MKYLIIVSLLLLSGCPARVDPSSKMQHQLCAGELATKDSISSYEDVLNYLHLPIPDVVNAIEAAKKGKLYAEQSAKFQSDAAASGLLVDGEKEKLQKRIDKLENAWLAPWQQKFLAWLIATGLLVVLAFWFSPSPVKIITIIRGFFSRG